MGSEKFKVGDIVTQCHKRALVAWNGVETDLHPDLHGLDLKLEISDIDIDGDVCVINRSGFEIIFENSNYYSCPEGGGLNIILNSAYLKYYESKNKILKKFF